ncbi:hypothetical protein [Myxococcus stipitatus]
MPARSPDNLGPTRVPGTDNGAAVDVLDEVSSMGTGRPCDDGSQVG